MTSRGLLAGLLDRELTGNKRSSVPSSFSHAFSCSGRHAGVIQVDPDGDPSPPYSIAYNQAVHGCRFLTVGDEEGSVAIVDTRADTLPDSLYTDTANPPRAKWLAHNNTIFDMAWAKDDSVLYTASGDQQVGVWDTAAGRLKSYCSGHDGSVKVVTPHTTTHDIFASGSRDGGILVWDMRVARTWSASRRRMQLQPVARINITTPAAHHHTPRPASAGGAAPGAGGTPGSGSKPSRALGKPARRSVTSLLFLPQDGNSLVSSSDMDGTVKLWDLRSLTTPTADITLPPAAAAAAAAAAAQGGGARGRGGRGGVIGARGSISVYGAAWLSFSCPGRMNRPSGITSMALAPSGDMLLVSSIDSCHYLYRLSQLDGPPVACFTGHRAGSFCVKACFSPCGDYLISGSSDSKAYMWQVSKPSLPPVTLSGHEGEVTAVAWCPQDYCHLATAADDATVRVWHMDRANSAYQRQFDHHNYSFADPHVDPLWARFGVGAAAAADEDAALGTALSGLQLQQQHQQQQEAKAAAAVATAAAAPGAVTGAEGGVGGVTPFRGDRPLQQRSICSPTTPQLPFWRTKGAGADGEAGNGCNAAAGAGAGAGVVSLAQQQGQEGVAAGVGSSQPEHMMDIEGGTAAAAAAVAAAVAPGGAASGAGGGMDAGSCFTPARQRCTGAPGYTPMLPPQQPLSTPAGPAAAVAAAAAAPPAGIASLLAGPSAAAAAAAAATGAAGPSSAAKASAVKRSVGRTGGRPSTAKGVKGAKGSAAKASAVKASGGMRQLTLMEQLAAAAAKTKPAAAEEHAATAACEAGEADKGAGDAAQGQQQPAVEAAGQVHVPGQGAGTMNSAAAAAALLSGHPTQPVVTGAEAAAPAAAAAAAAGEVGAGAALGGMFGPLLANSGGCGTLGGRGTPWSLQRQMQRTHLDEVCKQQQQQQQGMEVCGGPGSSKGVPADRSSRGAGCSAVRLLHDEFEVFCDDDSQPAAAAPAAAALAAAALAAAGAGEAADAEGPCGGDRQLAATAADAGQVEAAGGRGAHVEGGCVGRKAARRLLGVDVSQASVSAAAGAAGSAGLLSPSCQENVWLAATAGATTGALAGLHDPAVAAGAAGPHVCDSPMDVDMVPCSLPVDQHLDTDSQQQSQQQQPQGAEPAPQQQQLLQHLPGFRPRGVCRFNSMPLPPKVAEVLGVSRMPLGDLSPLLLPHTTPGTVPAAAAAASGETTGSGARGDGSGGSGLRATSLSPGALGGVGQLTRARLDLGARSSPVRVLNMGMGPPAAAAGRSQGAGGGVSVLQMLGQDSQQQQQQQLQQQQGGSALRGAAGMLLSGTQSHHHHQQQQYSGPQGGQQFLSPQHQQCSLRRPCSPLKPKHVSPDGCTGAAPGSPERYSQQQFVSGGGSGGVHSSGDGVPRKRSRLGECTPEKHRAAGSQGAAHHQPQPVPSFSQRLAAAAATQQDQQQQQQQHEPGYQLAAGGAAAGGRGQHAVLALDGPHQFQGADGRWHVLHSDGREVIYLTREQYQLQEQRQQQELGVRQVQPLVEVTPAAQVPAPGSSTFHLPEQWPGENGSAHIRYADGREEVYVRARQPDRQLCQDRAQSALKRPEPPGGEGGNDSHACQLPDQLTLGAADRPGGSNQQQQIDLPEQHPLPSFLARQTAALQQQYHQRWQQQQEEAEAADEGCGEAGDAAAAVVAAAAAGGMRRSAVAPASGRKRQCRLADLWAAKQPEVEDGASRFSGY